MININSEYEGMEWKDVVGLEVSQVLATWDVESMPRIVLFYGPYGCGKNLLAYLFAKKLPSVQITVRNTVDNTAKGAEEMISQFSAPPLLPDATQVCVLNEFTDFRKDAQRKWKDILQTPPERTYFFICTNEEQKIIPDIWDRVDLAVKVHLLDAKQAYTLVSKACDKHGITLPKVKKRAIARGSGGRPRTIIKTVQAVANSNDDSDSFIRSQLDTYSGEGNETAFMELFQYLNGMLYYKGDTKGIIQLIEATGMDANAIKFKMLHMIWNRYSHSAQALFLALIPPLEQGGEKFDLLARFMRILKL